MTLTARLVTGLVVAAVTLLGLVVLRPAGTTLAAWSDEVTVAVPTLRTGGVQLAVTPAGGAATVAMTGEAAGTWRPSTVQVAAQGQALTGADLAGARVEYRLADGTLAYRAALDGGAASFPVSGDRRLAGTHTLFLTVVPSDRVLVAHGGATLSVTTTIDGATTAPATWTAAGTWVAEEELGPGPSVASLTCTPGPLGTRVTLDWDWDWDRGGLAQDVTRWSVQVEEGGTWHELHTLPAQHSFVHVRARDFDLVEIGTHTLRVAAVLPDGTTIPSDTTRIHVLCLVVGGVRCA